MTEKKSKITLLLSEEQELAICAFFNHQDWDWDEALVAREPVQDVQPDNDLCEDPQPVPAPTDQAQDDEQEGMCNWCYCVPCIATPHYQQAWWPSHPHQPKAGNNRARKECYKKFWSMLSNMGVWKSQQYRRKKAMALGQKPANKLKNFVSHKREIMPDCVIKLVRSWFPNEEGNLYMGHLWV